MKLDKMKLENPYDVFTDKQKKSLKFRLSNLFVDIKCWFIKRRIK